MGRAGDETAGGERRARLTRRRFLQAGAATPVLLAGVGAVPGRAPEAGASPARAPAGPFPLGVYGGELEYYRMAPHDVAPRLARAREAGFTTIQTYVPWNVHEHTRGVVDFSGRTHPLIVNDHVDRFATEAPGRQVRTGGARGQVVANTDLEAFLRGCRRLGLSVILRPGPFISDEWRNGGIPDWVLASGDPGIFMRGPHRSATLQPAFPFTPPVGIVTGGGPGYYFPGPSYASTAYLAEVRRWLTGVFAPVVAPWLAPNGGPVVALQVDDETCYYYEFGPFEVDYHPEMVARYRARHHREPPTAFPPGAGDPGVLVPALTWQRFKADQIRAYLATLVADLRGAGLGGVAYTHELTTNLSPPPDPGRDAEAALVLPEFYFGDSGPWSEPANELAAQAIRAAQRNRVPVVAAEMQEDDVLLYYLLFGEEVLGGLQFEYTEGVPTRSFPQLKALGATLATAGRTVAAARRRVDTAIVWDPEWCYVPHGSRRYGFDQDVRAVAEAHLPALATLLSRAGYAWDLLDATRAAPEDYRAYPCVWLVGADVLPHAAQAALLAYLRGGGRLVCFPAPPRLDGDYAPDTTLAEAAFPEPLGVFHPGDAQRVEVLGQPVTTWRGVQTYTLTRGGRPVARRGQEVCGYRRGVGAGEAILLGSFLAADSVPGWSGVVQAVEEVPPGGAPGVARGAAGALGPRAVGGLPAPPWPGGEPEAIVVYTYLNQRRGAEMVPAGAVAAWDGANPVPLVRVNEDPTAPPVEHPPFHPVLPEHQRAARLLAGHRPAVWVSDHRVRARVLDAPSPGVATLAVANRYPRALAVAIVVEVGGRRVRLPQVGTLALPPATGLLLPVHYPLGPGARLVQATAQLLDARVDATRVALRVAAPAGGEVVLALSGPPASTTLDGRPVRAHRSPGPGGGTTLRVGVPAGTHDLAVHRAR